jgi:multiple sugar transport system permease protein
MSETTLTAKTPARRRRKLTPYYFVAPAAIFLFVGTIFMMGYSLVISLTQYQLQLNTAPEFTGLSNYVEALQDEKFLRSIYQTVLIGAPALVGEFVLGFTLALMLNRNFPGRSVAISLIATPVMISSAAAGMAFRLLYEPRYGPINDILSRLTGTTVQIDWLGSVALARPAMTFVDIWHASPFVMLLLLAGLGGISDDIYEAAKVDGANAVQMFTRITVPLLKPVLILIVLLRGVDLTRIFDFIYIMTKGGPGTETQTVSFYIFTNGLQFFRVGYGAAMAWLLAFVTIIFAKYYLDLMKKKEG